MRWKKIMERRFSFERRGVNSSGDNIFLFRKEWKNMLWREYIFMTMFMTLKNFNPLHIYMNFDPPPEFWEKTPSQRKFACPPMGRVLEVHRKFELHHICNHQLEFELVHSMRTIFHKAKKLDFATFQESRKHLGQIK